MYSSYFDSLNNLKQSIPQNYENKDELLRIINYCIDDMAYKSPELLSECFRNYCIMIIPYLPSNRESNSWVNDPWDNIHDVAKKNNKFYQEKI